MSEPLRYFYLLHISEDGDVNIKTICRSELMDLIRDLGPPCEDHLPSMDGSKCKKTQGGCWVVISGNLVVARPVTTVTEWRFDEQQ